MQDMSLAVEEESTRDPFQKFAVGMKTLAALEQEPHAYLNQFSLMGSSTEGDHLVLLFPGIVPQAQFAFRKQQDILQQIPGPIVSIDYPDKGFSMQMLAAQVQDFLHSPFAQGKKITFMGSSFGTTCILRLLGSEDFSDLDMQKLVLLGGIRDVTDFRHETVKHTVRFARSLSSSFLASHVTGIIKKLMNVDPKFFSDDEDTTIQNHALTAIDNDGLAQRFALFLENALPLPTIHIPSLFYWWESERTTPEKQRDIIQHFTHTQEITIPGEHGTLATSAPDINPHLQRFLLS